MTKISILSQQSVDHLRMICKNKVNILKYDFEDLKEEFRLFEVETKIDFDESVKLLSPEGLAQEENNDLNNCILIRKALPNLKDIDATDERLWVTLCLRDYKTYTLERWPHKPRTSEVQHRINHWFASTVRNRMRDNAIGRLWWYQRLCNRISNANFEKVLESLFFNSDYRSSMLERNTSSAITKVVSIIIEITEEQKSKGIYYNRQNFRDFMQKINFLAGRSRLAALNEAQLKETLEKLYLESYT